MSSADEKQIGGAHYKGVPEPLQHWNVVAALGWDYFIGAATKYLWRLGKKQGVDPLKDLEKAIHYLEKKRELMLAAPPPEEPNDWDAKVSLDGWVGLTFEGCDATGNRFRCKTCGLHFVAPRGSVPMDHHACGAEPTGAYVGQ